ncbi:hypothetical protein [Citrobacter murliniae]
MLYIALVNIICVCMYLLNITKGWMLIPWVLR